MSACRCRRWDEVRAGRDLHVIDGLTVTKMSNEGGDYATVLGTLCVASGQHNWNVYINHVEDSNLFIGATVGGHDLNADPQVRAFGIQCIKHAMLCMTNDAGLTTGLGAST